MTIVKKLMVLCVLAALGISFYRYRYAYQNPSWSTIYEKDLKAIQVTLEENHPGFYDQENPAFKKWLTEGYKHALKTADQVVSFDRYKMALEAYVSGFKDNHLRLLWHDQSMPGSKPERERLATAKQLAEKQIWITVPSFHPQSVQEEDALKTVIDSMAQYRDYELIIFDVRGNTGGNSAYGTRLLNTLYGQSYCNARFKKLYATSYVEWRASEGNRAYLKELIPQLEKKFGQSPTVTEFSNILSGMEKSIVAGKPFYATQPNPLESVESPTIANPVHARVVVITDRECASTCLSFMDELFALGPVEHVGLPTNVDTDYMECRDVALPSGLVTLHFPIKVFRNRARKANEAYIPHCHISDVQDDEILTKVITNSKEWGAYCLHQSIPTPP